MDGLEVQIFHFGAAEVSLELLSCEAWDLTCKLRAVVVRDETELGVEGEGH